MSTPALTPEHLQQLRTTGLSAKWVAERLGIGPIAAKALLIAVGAYRGKGSQYRLPGPRLNTFGEGRECTPRSATTGALLGVALERG